MMKVAIMQPYLFPYIGYFQLIHAVDRFIFYDDVDFIKQGWIARNRVLVNGKPFLFTIPLVSPSSYQKINKTAIHQHQYQRWRNKFFKTAELSYKKAPYFDRVMFLIQEVLMRDYEFINELARESIISVCQYLDISTKFISTSEIYNNENLKAQDRVLDICKKEGADQYINAIGGQELYKREDFSEQGIDLCFLNPQPVTYLQFDKEFVPWLSIIDVMMFNSVEDIQKILNKYTLVE